MMSFEEFYHSGKHFIVHNVQSLSLLVGLFVIYLLITMEEGFTNYGEYPAVLSGADKGSVKDPVKSGSGVTKENIIPSPKPLTQKPTPTMQKETDYLSQNKSSDDANFVGSYSLLPKGMVPQNDFKKNSQLLSNRPTTGNISGIIEGDMFQGIGDLTESRDTQVKPTATMSSKIVTLLLIYAPWCGHSKRALPDFDRIMSEMNNTSENGVKIVVEKHDSDVNKEIVKKYNVRGFPHYIMEVSEDGVVTKTVTVQSRDYDGLKKAIMNNV